MAFPEFSFFFEFLTDVTTTGIRTPQIRAKKMTAKTVREQPNGRRQKALILPHVELSVSTGCVTVVSQFTISNSSKKYLQKCVFLKVIQECSFYYLACGGSQKA